MTAINSNRAIRGPVTAVPVVAGKGVRLVADTENNRWVVEADETVLFEVSTGDTPVASATLSESASNFERLRLVFGVDTNVVSSSHPDVQAENELYVRPGFTSYQLGVTAYNIGSGNPLQIWGAKITINGTTITVDNGMRRWFNANQGDTMKPVIYKVVGINRIASA